MAYTNYYRDSGMFHASMPLIMHTRLDVLLFGESEKQLVDVWDESEKELNRMEKIFNRFDRESEVAKVNTDAQFRPVELSNELWNVILECYEFYTKTDGNFDITLSNFKHLTVMKESQSIQFDKYGMLIDFGGIAKGYALKKMESIIKKADIRRALINFGNSSVLAVGSHPHGDNWKIGINNPFENKLSTTLCLCDSSMSISGNSPQNKRHIYGKDNNFIEENKIVAIITGDPVDAEVVTTAWIASQEETPAWLRNFDIKNKYYIKC
jgi:thiamine biosynthesis lipoprotein